MRIAYLTAGAAGMYCGSCMHDNALARALIAAGHDCVLLPVYTPITTDEADVSSKEIFFGGINVYLQQKLPWIGKLPRFLVRWLDNPRLIQLATRRAGSTQAELLGELTVSMLQGTHGHQRSEVIRLANWLRDDYSPDAIILTNLLIGGAIPEMRRATGARVYVWLQGDDIFLDHLPEGYRADAIRWMRERGEQADKLLVNSQFYAQKMGQMLGISQEKFVVVPLAIDLSDFGPRREFAESELQQSSSSNEPLKIGYFARLAPEKGFDLAAKAFAELTKRVSPERVEFHYGGWLGQQHQHYFDEVCKFLDQIPGRPRHVHHGSPSRQEKAALLSSFDIFSVPAPYADPKGLFVLESLACAVPVVEPNHGAFPEMLGSTGGGILVEPESPIALADAYEELMNHPHERMLLGREGYEGVHAKHTIEQQAEKIEQILRKGKCGT